jgi:molybdate transport system ATP-binding protein
MLSVDIKQRLGAFSLDVQFVSKAKVIALFGRSGSGKTSIVNAIAGVSRPTAGAIRIDDTVLFDQTRGIWVPPAKRRVGYVFQDGLLFPHMTVAKNLTYGQAAVGIEGTERIDADKVIEVLGLRDLLSRHPANLSGGERQRVAIGRALLANPRMLLLDEPLASLDDQRKRDVMQYIERLRDEFGIPMVLVSHSHDEVARLAEEMVLISDGRVIQTGAVEDIMSRLDLSPLTGRFEAGSVIRATVAAHDDQYALTTLAFTGGTLLVPKIDAAVGDVATARIRARDVSVALTAPTDISINNVLHGVVRDIRRDTGPIVDLQVQVGDALILARITRLSADKLALRAELPVYLLLKTISLDKKSLAFA